MSIIQARRTAAEETCLCCGARHITETFVGYQLCFTCLRANCRYRRQRCQGALYPARLPNFDDIVSDQDSIARDERNNDNMAFGRPRIDWAWAGMQPWQPGEYPNTVALIVYDRSMWAQGRESTTFWRYSNTNGRTHTLHRQIPDEVYDQRNWFSWWKRQIRDWRYRGYQQVPFHDTRYGTIPLGIEATILPTRSVTVAPGALNGLPIALWQEQIIRELHAQAHRDIDLGRNTSTIRVMIEMMRKAERYRQAYYQRQSAPYVELGQVLSLLEQQAVTMDTLLHHALHVEEPAPRYGPFPWDPSKVVPD
jgi:hypothetical protein